MTQQEAEAWNLLDMALHSVRVAPSGRILGFEWAAIYQAVTARGYDAEILPELLAEAEAALLSRFAGE